MTDVLWRVGKVVNAKAVVEDFVLKTKVDPDTITLTIHKPSGEETRTFTKDATGEYHASAPVKLTEEGFWKFVVNTTGVYEDVEVAAITVYPV